MKLRNIITKTTSALALACMFIIAVAHSAWATTGHTYVSVNGHDYSGCTRDAPCRTFANAIYRTAVGGEITALDTGQYGSVVVRNSLTLDGAPGMSAVINETVNSPTAISVDTAESDVVVLRNLLISSVTTPMDPFSHNGVDLLRAGTLYIEGCVIRGWANDGILVDNFHATAVRLFVSETVVTNTRVGIELFGDLTTQVSIEHCRIENNQIGLFTAVTAAVRDTVASGNREGFSNVDGDLTIANCKASNNQVGIINRYGTLRVTRSVVTNNSTSGFTSYSGVFESLGNNLVRGNGQNTQGTITTIAGS